MTAATAPGTPDPAVTASATGPAGAAELTSAIAPGCGTSGTSGATGPTSATASAAVRGQAGAGDQAGASNQAGASGPADPGELAGRLRTVVHRLSHQLRGPVDKHGLTPTRLAVLAALKEADAPVRPGDLATRLAISPPGMSRLVEILEHAGWVMRQSDPADQRACLLSLTPDGHATMAGLARQSTGRLAGDVAALSSADRDRLAAALGVLEHLAEQGVCRPAEGAGCDHAPAPVKPDATAGLGTS